MPRLPIMRVIGSHDISTICGGLVPAWARSVAVMAVSLPDSRSTTRFSLCRPRPIRTPVRVVTGGQCRPVVAPLGFGVEHDVGDAAHPADKGAVGLIQH